jgi:AcrR family transcriptional regulator
MSTALTITRERVPASGRTATAERRHALTRMREERPGEPSSPQVLEIQRARLLAGAVHAVDELGYANTTVTEITTRARVSRRTFYELFSNREQCVIAVLEDTERRVRAEIAQTGIARLSWRERIREGVSLILAFLDRNPALARVCVVHSAGASQPVQRSRTKILAELAAAIDDDHTDRPTDSAARMDCPPLTAEGLVGAAASIIYGRLSHTEHEPLGSLLSELAGMIVLPYLGPTIAREEHERPTNTQSYEMKKRQPGGSGQTSGDPLGAIPMRLTYRTARVLEALAEHPGISNRVLGEQAGMTDQGQTSKLLARLERYGLLENAGKHSGKGEPNAWNLTPAGHTLTHTITLSNRHPSQTA